jgi:transcriptional regulator with XRE-family HTH domain
MPRTSRRPPEDDFYRDLARNLRAARVAAGKTQSEVGEYLGMTFQQVQKYEKGLNRIPVYGLVILADFLAVPVSQLIAPSDGDSEFQSLAVQFSSKEFHALMEAWGTIKDRPIRAALLNLVKRMAALGH